MSGGPEWLSGIAGFDPGRWWALIVCTRKSEPHSTEIVGVMFDHAEGRGLHYGGPGIHHERTEPHRESVRKQGNRDRHLANNKMSSQKTAVRGESRPTLARRVTSAAGSMNIRCPECNHNIRRPRSEWGATIERARRVGVAQIGMSALD